MNRYLTRYLTLATLLTAFACIGAAHAATRDEQEDACRGDAMRLCSAEIPNEAKITGCMKQNLSQLSPRCRAMFNSSKPAKSKSGT